MLEKIGEGAEAVILKENNFIIKHRKIKSYRIPELDYFLRKFRTKREAKFIEKLKEIGVNAPSLISFDDKNMQIKIDFIKGYLLKDIFDDNFEKFSREIGKIIATLHKNHMIHGDLTTSNMIVKDNKIYLIDFGLSFFSEKIEDKAVDLHLLRQALESKHWKVFTQAFEIIKEEYAKNYKHAPSIFKRLQQVELRGRYKKKDVDFKLHSL